ncbi:uncharacterized protein LOC107042039 [Diachasma alloeum]|uniref:uncharacterized protein LOC107042039 n=1 Tax=Diachasma alloeum TaxID=454923 RepID=UPI000738270A|nr:uncharacterized protein LOC107042039 [Diachasma alloeum]
MYGLRKVHKEGCKLRPVVSCRGPPRYKIAKYLHRLLSKVQEKSQFSIKNSKEFVDFVEGNRLLEGYELVSLDVVSLFTNIPKELVLTIIEKNWEIWSSLIPAPKDVVVQLVQFCFEVSYFVFDSEIHNQIDGSIMGNPASPILASLVMDHVLSKVLEKIPVRISWVKLYVDDTLLAVPTEAVEAIREAFNSIHPRIQFTVERETEGAICFLDVKVIREENGLLRTNWYQKPTSAGRVVNYRSNHPTSQKIGVVFGLLHRAIGLSHGSFHEENVSRVRRVLVNNNYPAKFISKCVRNFRERRDLQTAGAVREHRRVFRLPLITGLSQRLNRGMRHTDSRFVMYNLRKVGDLYSRLKDETPIFDRFGVVYKIPCECEKCYLGQTKQLLRERVSQHRRDCEPRKFNKEEKNVLAFHHFTTEQCFKFEETSILDVAPNWRKRNISEMVHISLNKTVNKREDTQHLSGM